MRRLVISFAALAALSAAAIADPAERAVAPVPFQLNAAQLDGVTAGAHDSSVEVLPLEDFVDQMQSIKTIIGSEGTNNSDTRHTPFFTNYRPQFYIDLR